MARKGTKIKRYGNIYGRGIGAGSWHIVVAMFVGVLLFGAVGWSLYTPVHEFVMKLGEELPAKPFAASSSVSAAQSLAASVPGTEPSASNVVPGSASSQPSASGASQQFYGLYLPLTQLSNETVFSGSLAAATATGLNTVVVDAKDATGKILFSSKNALAKQTGAADDTAFSAKSVADKIKAQELTPAARIHAFRDSLAPMYDRKMAVKYYDTEVYWYDNAPNLGGKPWLNPYSEDAQNYIISLAEELCEQGFEIIVLDSVQFPSGVGLDKAGYGPLTKTVGKAEVLRTFVSKISASIKAKGGELILCMQDDWLPTEDQAQNTILTARNDSYYGGSPAAFFSEKVLLGLPSDATVWSRILKTAAQVDANAQWIGTIPAYAADGTPADCKALISAFNGAGGGSYLLYNPQGNYKLQ